MNEMRYVIAVAHRDHNGRNVWGVYDDVTKLFVVNLFYQTKACARRVANGMNEQIMPKKRCEGDSQCKKSPVRGSKFCADHIAFSDDQETK